MFPLIEDRPFPNFELQIFIPIGNSMKGPKQFK